MNDLVIGFIGAWIGALTVAGVLFAIYRWETAKRAKMAKKLGEDLRSMLAQKLGSQAFESEDYRGNTFN